MFIVAVWTVAMGVILLGAAVFLPELWRALREWFAPVRVDNVISIDERRRQLRCAGSSRRELLTIAALVGLLFATLACAPVIHCSTRMVGYTDYGNDGAVIGHREIPIEVCN